MTKNRGVASARTQQAAFAANRFGAISPPAKLARFLGCDPGCYIRFHPGFEPESERVLNIGSSKVPIFVTTEDLNEATANVSRTAWKHPEFYHASPAVRAKAIRWIWSNESQKGALDSKQFDDPRSLASQALNLVILDQIIEAWEHEARYVRRGLASNPREAAEWGAQLVKYGDPQQRLFLKKIFQVVRVGYNVYRLEDGEDPVFLGEATTLAKAKAIAAKRDRNAGLPKSLYGTARAAGHVAGMSAPDGDELNGQNDVVWLKNNVGAIPTLWVVR